MTRLGFRLCLLVLLGMQALAPDLRAEEWLHLDPLRWEAFVRFDGRWEEQDNNAKSRDLDFKQGLRFQQTGHSLDPRIANFSLEFEPIFNQSDFHSTVAEDENRDGISLNYNGRLSLFQGTPGPIGASAFAARSDSTLDGSLGSRTDIESQNWGVGLNWKTKLFPTTLSYEEHATDQTFRAGLTSSTSERDEIRRTVRLRGRSTKMDLALEREWFDDRTGTDSDSETNRARLGHRLGWGNGSRLTSRLDFIDRNQFNPFERLSIFENLEIHHTSDLSSSTDYRFTWSDQQVESTEHQGVFTLTHNLYENLTSSGHLLGSYRDADISQETEYGGGLDFNYRKQIFQDVGFRAGLGGGYRITDRDTSNGVLREVDEPHAVGVTTISFLLNRRFVIEPSIIITDGGGVTFAEGPDYLVVSAPSDFTEIQIVPGGQISAGAPITVFATYDYQPQPSEKFSTTDFSYDLGLDFGWMSIYRDYSRQDESRISGEEASTLVDREDSRTGVELRWVRPPTSATLVFERGLLVSGDHESESYRFRQTAIHTFGPGVTLNFAASQNFTDADNQDTDLYTADLSLTWRPPRSRLFVRPNLSTWMRNDKGSAVTGGERDEKVLKGGVDFRWSWRKLSVDLQYWHAIRRGDINERDEDRVIMTVRRGF